MPARRRALRNHLVITCEHGGNHVPARFQTLFAGQQDRLNSHEGYDPGTLELARRFARHFGVPLYEATVTRLLVELNRSKHHCQFFSSITRSLEPSVREEIVRQYYLPYRAAVQRQVTELVESGGRVIHLSIHSFTPVWRGEERLADIGFLYDPGRPGERRTSALWRDELKRMRPELIVRRNYPYLGKADGQTKTLRGLFSSDEYVGIEVEVNQKWPKKNRPIWQRLQTSMIVGFEAVWPSL